MKLKKIASLALAGIMAVSMLAGCKDGGNSNSGSSSSNNTNPTNNFTTTVMAKASKATNDILAVSSDDTLDEAVAFSAENNVLTSQATTLATTGNTSGFVTVAEKVADDWEFIASSSYDVSDWTFTDGSHDEDETYWTLYYVAAPKTTDWIAGEIAGKLDDMVKTTGNMSAANCEYSVRVAVSDIESANSGSYDGYLIGVAITVDNTENNH